MKTDSEILVNDNGTLLHTYLYIYIYTHIIYTNITSHTDSLNQEDLMRLDP